MEWLSQNWIWIVIAGAVLWFFARRGHGGAMGGCGMAHEGPQEGAKAESASAQTKDKDAASSGHRRGGCC